MAPDIARVEKPVCTIDVSNQLNGAQNKTTAAAEAASRQQVSSWKDKI
jgi:hypothetical protein